MMAYVKLEAKYLDVRKSGALPSHGPALETIYSGGGGGGGGGGGDGPRVTELRCSGPGSCVVKSEELRMSTLKMRRICPCYATTMRQFMFPIWLG